MKKYKLTKVDLAIIDHSKELKSKVYLCKDHGVFLRLADGGNKCPFCKSACSEYKDKEL